MNALLFEALGDIDERFIAETASSAPPKRIPHWIKLTAIVTVIAIICCSFFAYSTISKHKYTSNTEYYSVSLKNGKYYLDFHNDDIAPWVPDIHDDLQVVIDAPYVYFYSVEEMRSDLLTGNFTDYELSVIKTRCGAGGHMELPNLSRLYEPTFPDTYCGYMIPLCGNAYHFAFLTDVEYDDTIDKNTIDGFRFYSSQPTARLDVCTKESYLSAISHLKDLEGYTPTTKKGIQSTEYYVTDSLGNNQKIVVYKSVKFGKTMYIEERFNDPQSSTPSMVFFYGKEKKISLNNEKNVYFSGRLRNPTGNYSYEKVLEFGVKVNKS